MFVFVFISGFLSFSESNLFNLAIFLRIRLNIMIVTKTQTIIPIKYDTE